MCGIAFCFSNEMDCLDGIRARRTKCSSAFGGFLDAAMDGITYYCHSSLVAYTVRVPNWQIIFLFWNFFSYVG
jgi:phosphatidylglycerophosphate synthase